MELVMHDHIGLPIRVISAIRGSLLPWLWPLGLRRVLRGEKNMPGMCKWRYLSNYSAGTSHDMRVRVGAGCRDRFRTAASRTGSRSSPLQKRLNSKAFWRAELCDAVVLGDVKHPRQILT